MSARPLMKARPERIADAIARCEAAGAGHYTPLLRAVSARLVAAAFVPRHAEPGEVSITALNRLRLPVVAVLHDDDHAATGPAGFRAARKVLRWVRAVMVHASGGEAEHYASAVDAARTLGSCALIETSSGWADAWRDAAIRAALPRRVPILTIIPREGAHPVAPVVN